MRQWQCQCARSSFGAPHHLAPTSTSDFQLSPSLSPSLSLSATSKGLIFFKVRVSMAVGAFQTLHMKHAQICWWSYCFNSVLNCQTVHAQCALSGWTDPVHSRNFTTYSVRLLQFQCRDDQKRGNLYLAQQSSAASQKKCPWHSSSRLIIWRRGSASPR